MADIHKKWCRSCNTWKCTITRSTSQITWHIYKFDKQRYQTLSCNEENVPDIYQKYLSNVLCPAWILASEIHLINIRGCKSLLVFFISCFSPLEFSVFVSGSNSLSILMHTGFDTFHYNSTDIVLCSQLITLRITLQTQSWILPQCLPFCSVVSQESLMVLTCQVRDVFDRLLVCLFLWISFSYLYLLCLTVPFSFSLL